ncbi:rhomboid family intramembrane serine protease [Phaeocystidibacter marisrubri]|uniref:Rhomboid family intramembrane serine protease n=1 Tax=Phaeocystidibacter marisrubri TaxID=1577780 RepID=A0A6L3ZKK6_9FLAO|nr:rhomboid family intramembrane serine protease [Phaeocystidibacter marisrubri]KAB2817700.1 rhomboid family intramembrane serine protease [Phaeocystidibacter marisrubri]GGH74030.1 hypothetical protein GCM10011318_19590 [Phaeocystidibacter marisrubri]
MNPLEQRKPLWTYTIFPGLVVAALIAIHAIGVIFDLDLSQHGLRPRDSNRVFGVITFFFLHGSWEHLFNNVVGLFVLLSLMRYYFPTIFLKILVFSILFPAIGTFAIARDAIHIGASGAIYSLAAFLFVSSLIRANRYMLSLSLLIIFLYGGLWWGLFPLDNHVSYEGHFAGAVTGIVMAFIYSKAPYNAHVKEPEPEFEKEDVPDVIGDAWKITQPIEVRYIYVDDKDETDTPDDSSPDDSDDGGTTIPGNPR